MSFLSDYKIKRGPVIALLLVVGLVGAYVIGRQTLRPSVEVLLPVTVPDAYQGTTYAFDGLVCLQAGSVGVEVTGVSGGDGEVRTELVGAPEGAPVTVAFPVEPDAGVPLSGLTIPAGGEECVRLLTTPDEQGDLAAGQLSVSFGYGPLGLLRSSLDIDPTVTLQVTGTGVDPRTDAG